MAKPNKSSFLVGQNKGCQYFRHPRGERPDEFYTCRSFNLEEVKNEITNQEKELTLAPCVVVGKEELKETSLSDPKIYTVTHTSVLIQKFPERLCIS